MNSQLLSYNQSQLRVFTICGDGITRYPEVCDDGNNIGNDGCSGTFQGLIFIP